MASTNEHALPNVLRRLDELEIRVPVDMSIVAICPEDQAHDTHPAISNVSLPAAELGIVAVDPTPSAARRKERCARRAALDAHTSRQCQQTRRASTPSQLRVWATVQSIGALDASG